MADQVGVPTGATLIADVTAECIKKSLTNADLAGIYNIVPSGETNWCDYARLIVTVASKLGKSMTLSPEDITGVTTAEYQTPATRPLNSRLSAAKLKHDFGLDLPHWECGVSATVKSILSLE